MDPGIFELRHILEDVPSRPAERQLLPCMTHQRREYAALSTYVYTKLHIIRRAHPSGPLLTAGHSCPPSDMQLGVHIRGGHCLRFAPLVKHVMLCSRRRSLFKLSSSCGACHVLFQEKGIEEGSLAVFLGFLQSTSIRDLVLANCRLHLAIHDGRLSRLGRHDDSVAELLTSLPDFSCSAVVFLRLGGFQARQTYFLLGEVTVNDRMALRGPHLLPFLRGFTHLSDLDLSLDKNSNSGNPLLVDDRVLTSFFQTLSVNFRTLQSLKVSHWKVCLDESDKTLRAVGRALKTCSLSHLKVNGVSVTDSTHKVSLQHLFLQTVVANLSYLSWLSMVGVCLTPGQATAVGKCIRDRFPGSGLEVSAKDVGVDAVKSLVTALEEGNKIEVMYLGGVSCTLRIQRILKNQKLKGKFRRFTSLKE
uniref:Uncharacterized protein n=1 Tax=Timema douglasi TaxID=61478 RepID=A0A7R8VN20_TIMDO|nr:unnamed protein product [Timema douglasi]